MPTYRQPASEAVLAIAIIARLYAPGEAGELFQLRHGHDQHAFACQVLVVLKGWGWNDPDKLNVNGSGISLGHPIGATGVRILATMLNEMKRRDAKYGLETMCIGGGQGIAAIFERA